VEITFTDAGGGLTRVDVTHSRFEGLAGAAAVAETVGGNNGWRTIMGRFEASFSPTGEKMKFPGESHR